MANANASNLITYGSFSTASVVNKTHFSEFYPNDGYGIFSRNDIPILIGAAAGAVGLVLIIVTAALIWHCCQFALQREKSNYSLDRESERNSISSHGSHVFNTNSESLVFAGTKTFEESLNELNIKRSVSVPLSRTCLDRTIPLTRPKLVYNNNLNSHLIGEAEKANSTKPYPNFLQVLVENENNKLGSEERKGSKYTPSCDRMKTQSLPWTHSKRKPTGQLSGQEVEANKSESDEVDGKINFSKKRKNRMRNDSAAAIALNKSGATAVQVTSHKDTDTLVDNEAVVVYDERTAL